MRPRFAASSTGEEYCRSPRRASLGSGENASCAERAATSANAPVSPSLTSFMRIGENRLKALRALLLLDGRDHCELGVLAARSPQIDELVGPRGMESEPLLCNLRNANGRGERGLLDDETRALRLGDAHARLGRDDRV